jgi:hypothetical protein
VPQGALVVSAIQIGDFVVVVRPTPCCENHRLIGTIFQVARLVRLEGRCNWCGQIPPPDHGADWDAPDSGAGGFSLSTLKRIPPLDELERDQIVKELSA